MYDEEKLIVFVDGFVIYEPDLTDYIYENIAQSWQCRTQVFRGVVVMNLTAPQIRDSIKNLAKENNADLRVLMCIFWGCSW